MEKVIKEIEFAPGKTLSIETGRLAKQADGATVVRMGDTMVLCTAVSAKEAKPGQDFFPLTVDLRESFSAGGRFPGGFIKREGRPSDKEILSSRLIDRSIRPLFPNGYYHETQIICTVISSDGEHDGDVLGAVGASAALHIS
ncbi:MAG: polyribonucleotide nucleotidyltransferase, partial [Balneolaceae bacterium]|nr:polyribonucleotide nucleotidyltransferase [Balneolaceae bacterium]